MNDDFKIRLLGPYRFESPLDCRYFVEDDSVFCFQLSENAVHAAMTGRTGMLVGLWNGHFVHVPMGKAVSGRKKIDPTGPLWQSVLANTGQPANLG